MYRLHNQLMILEDTNFSVKFKKINYVWHIVEFF
jgi:hypothetical protein